MFFAPLCWFFRSTCARNFELYSEKIFLKFFCELSRIFFSFFCVPLRGSATKNAPFFTVLFFNQILKTMTNWVRFSPFYGQILGNFFNFSSVSQTIRLEFTEKILFDAIGSFFWNSNREEAPTCSAFKCSIMTNIFFTFPSSNLISFMLKSCASTRAYFRFFRATNTAAAKRSFPPRFSGTIYCLLIQFFNKS